jgi:phage-related protein
MDEFDPTDWPEFIELPGFTRAWAALALHDGDLRALQAAILSGPERHPVVPGTGGLRKLRFARPGEGRGKSGAYRVCYACFLHEGVVVLAMVYGKGEQADLTATQRKDIAAALRIIGDQLRRRAR